MRPFTTEVTEQHRGIIKTVCICVLCSEKAINVHMLSIIQTSKIK